MREFSRRRSFAFARARDLQLHGLRAGALFGDAEIMPARGNLILLPQPEIDYNTIAREGYMFGRRDGIVLGGTFERGQWSLEDPGAIAAIIEGHRSIFDAMS